VAYGKLFYRSIKKTAPKAKLSGLFL